MAERIKGAAPLALVIGVLAFVYIELGFNYTFHWGAGPDLVGPDGSKIGLALPNNFHLVVPITFISWGFFFAAGADKAAFVKVTLANVTGCLAAFAAMGLSSATAGAPKFWAIALWVTVLAVILVLMTAFGEWHYVPAAFGAFAAVFLWWTATGLDYWSPGGGGGANTLAGLGKDPGAGAFGGVLSTPWGWVVFDSFISLFIGGCLGLLTVTIVGMITPAAVAAEGEKEIVDAPHAR